MESSSAGSPHQTWFDPVIGTLHTWSCNFQVQNIYMETLTKPAKVKYPHFLTEAPNICQIFPPACSSWRLSTSIIAPPKNISFAPLSMKLSWRFSVTCFRARVLCFEFRLDRWVGCWTTPSPLRPSRLLRIDVRLLVAPQESLLPSLTFSSLSSPAQIPQRTLTFPKFTPHTRPKNYRGSVCLLCRPFAGPSPAVGWASGADGVSAHTNVVPAGAGESRESTGVAERDSEILLLLSCCC